MDALAATQRIWCQHLRISQIDRVGTRLVYRKHYESAADSWKAVVAFGVARVPPDLFGHSAGPSTVDIKFTWTDEAVGTHLAVRAEQKKLEIRSAPEFAEHNQTIERHDLVVDVDRFTTRSMPLDQFQSAEWLAGVNRMVSKDLPRFLATHETSS
jgi:hypothetical protein